MLDQFSRRRRQNGALQYAAGLLLATTVVHAAAQTSAQKPGQQAVRVVCLAEDAKKFADKDLRLLRWFGDLGDLIAGGSDISDKVAREIKNRYPPVGRWNFVPLGTGFVVHHEKNSSVIVTNWHVATACPTHRYPDSIAGSSSTAHNTEPVSTGLSLGVIEPLTGEIRPVLADIQVRRSFTNEKGEVTNQAVPVKVLCKQSGERCDVHVPSESGKLGRLERGEFKRRQDNVQIYVPDVAVLRSRDRIQLPALVLNPLAQADPQTPMYVHGFPQVAMQIQQDSVGSRRQMAEPVVTQASFARMLSLSNERPGLALDDVVKAELLMLSGQVHPGNSGGPILVNGEVVGMVTGTFTLDGRRSTTVPAGTLGGVGEDGKSAIPAGYGLAVQVADVVRVLDFFGVPYAKTPVAALPRPPEPTASASITPVLSPEPANGSLQNLVIGSLIGLAVLLAAVFGVVAWRKQQETNEPESEAVKPTVVVPVAPAVLVTPQSAPAVSLHASHGPLSGAFALPTPNGGLALFVGRDPKTCQVLFPDEHDIVSGMHCCFSWNAQHSALTVKDMSSNGTFVNGKKLDRATAHALKHGDTVDLGGANLNRFTAHFA